MRQPRAVAAVTLVAALLLLAGHASALMAPSASAQLLDHVRDMFRHGYDAYVEHALPQDELAPVSCGPLDTFAGFAATLIDSLDTMLVLGEYQRLNEALRWLRSQDNPFDRDAKVSVFEANIRLVGGLVSAHALLLDPQHAMYVAPAYDGCLLPLAEDIAQRLLPAFDSPTGMPYGTVHLQRGVLPGESKVTATSVVGTYLLEFGALSRLTGHPKYEDAARRALRAIWERRSPIGLVGNHINVETGEWKYTDATIGNAVDSFYEYLLKGALMFNDAELMLMFRQQYSAVNKHMRVGSMYMDANMRTGKPSSAAVSSLAAFWPGLQLLAGDLEDGLEMLRSVYQIWNANGVMPQLFDLAKMAVKDSHSYYPLRPEFAESVYYAYRATRDPAWLSVGRDIFVAIDKLCRVPCGYVGLADVRNHTMKMDQMDSFFLAETVKYLYMLFSLHSEPTHWLHTQPYMMTTEAHILPMLRDWWITGDPSANLRFADAPCRAPDVSDRLRVLGFFEKWEGAPGYDFDL